MDLEALIAILNLRDKLLSPKQEEVIYILEHANLQK